MMENRDRFQKLTYLVGFMDMLAVGLFIPLFPKYARQIGISPLNIGLFGSVYGCLQFVSSPIVGAWSDRTGKATVLVKCLILTAVGYYILSASDWILVILLSRIFSGCFKHTQSLTKAHLTDISEDSDHHKVFGFQSSISNLGFIIGPPIGGIISDYDNGFHIAAMLGATLFLLQASLVYLFLDNQPSKSKTKKSQSEFGILENLKIIFAKPGLREIFIIQFLISASSLLFRENASLLLHVRYQTSARNIGFMISFANFVSSISGFFVDKLAKLYGNDDSKILLRCTIVHVIGIWASTFAPEFWIYNFCLIPYKLSQAVSRVAIMNIMVESSGGTASGELMGSSQSILAISRILAPFICGLLQEVSVLVPGFLAGVLGIMMIPSIFRIYKVKDKEN